ncbi:unnamed protein product [Adineta ricciae]|uniref:MAM domain-containing protein n=1 Tax=Adineta ricciae TaxID=249248 RepID=A0A814SCW8_ADIRI|nr:unnamed protein product [Adineta ricciae]
MFLTISSVQYNQRCTFSLGTCDWHIGRRWQVKNLDEETEDKVLTAIDESHIDREKGFTDVITSPWLYLTSSCSFTVRLTFQFNIENEHDQIEVFLIKTNHSQTSSLGHWKALTQDHINTSDEIESLWQQANLTFKAADEFRIEIEIRHLPENKSTSTIWFAIDDILIENCPDFQTTTTSTTQTYPTMTTTVPWTTYSPFFSNDSSLLRRSFFRFRWKFNDSSQISTSEEFLSPRITFLTFILYIFYAFIAMAFSILLIALTIFIFRKYCLLPARKKPSSSSFPIIDRRYHSSKKHIYPHLTNYHNSHIDQDARTEKTMVTTIRPCY